MTQDTKAPERIWAGPTPVYRREEKWTWERGDWDESGDTVTYGELAEPYIRADLLTAAEARAEAAEVERDALKAENERLAGLVKDAVAGLREAENTPEPDHHVWQFRHVMAVIGNTLAKMEKTDDHTD